MEMETQNQADETMIYQSYKNNNNNSDNFIPLPKSLSNFLRTQE